LITGLLHLNAFLLILPVRSEDGGKLVLEKPNLLVEVVQPDHLVDDIGHVTHLVQGLVHLVLGEKFVFKLVDVLLCALQELTLVLLDCAADFRSLKELVEVGEHL